MNDSDTVWVNLKVLAELEPSQKLNTRHKYFQLQTTRYMPEFALRWWLGSNRESDFVCLKELYQAAADMLEKDKQSDSVRTRMCELLTLSTKGLISLQKTYENDATTRAKIEWLLDNVKTLITNNTDSISQVAC